MLPSFSLSEFVASKHGLAIIEVADRVSDEPWPCHLTVRILPSQGRYTGSIPVRATTQLFHVAGST